MLADLVKETTSTTGTGTITLGGAVTGFLSFATAEAAGDLVDGATVSYSVFDAGAYSTYRGVWDQTAGTLTRELVSGTLQSLSGSAVVSVGPIARDFDDLQDGIDAVASPSVTPVEIAMTTDPGDIATGFEFDAGLVNGPFAIPDLSLGENFSFDLGSGQNTALLAPEATGHEGKSGCIFFTTSFTGGTAEVVFGSNWWRGASSEVTVGSFNSIKIDEGTTAQVAYRIDPLGRWVVEIDAIQSIYQITLPPPPPPNAFSLILAPNADPFADPENGFQEVEFLDADDVSVFPAMTTSTAPSPLHAYGITSDGSYLPAEDANAFHALDGSTGTAFGGQEMGDTAAYLFLDSGSTTDTGIVKVRVTPGVTNDDVSLYFSGRSNLADLIDSPPGRYWAGAYFGAVAAGVPVDIDLAPAG